MNARDGYEDTPLLCAYKNGKKEALEILLKAGADMNMKDKDGNTILGEMRNQAILLCFGIFVVSLVVQFMILGVVSLESTIGEFSIPPLKTLVCIFVAVAAAVSIIGSSILYAGARSYIHFIKVEAEAEAGKFEPTDDNPPPYEA
ncbi:ankyrin repeat domain-containing protein [Wolbachia endosymbiont of Ctenocephalides felis wCfeT]|uniref:ankyrin repeat domain-containing protein n=1 Tax=Wolbachia endosymbiont of Ctenocephalides felis wCfeT TaxID=2732593 RepID=UPI0035101D98